MKKMLFGRVSAFAMLTAMAPIAAHAQSTPASEPQIADAERAETPQDIVVTGSRIRLPNLESLEPIKTVTKQYLDERNLTNAADALNEIPGIRGSVTPNGGQSANGQGVNFINTFGLGSNRTLTLVNGRRHVSSNTPSIDGPAAAGTQVDINVIPTSLIERIDNIAVGGAPIYGSDAIAGAINFILNTKYQGVQVSALTGVTEEGDGFRYNVNITAGTNFANDRGNVTFSYTRDRQAGLLFRDRAFLRDNIAFQQNPSAAQAATLGRPAGVTFANDGRLNTTIGFNNSATDGVPPLVLAQDARISFLTRGGLITTARNAAGAIVPGIARNFQFDNTGALTPFNRGIPFIGINSSGGEGFAFADFSQITSDLERDIFNGFASYEFTPALNFFAEATYARTRGDELVSQPTFNTSLFDGGPDGALTFGVESPFLTPQARAVLQARGVDSFAVSRVSLDLADVTGFSTNELYRIVAGFKGDFKIGGRDFFYEASGNYGRTDITDSSQDLNRQNFINAINVTTNAAGNIVCTATPTRQAAPLGEAPIADAACVPLNLLGEGLSDPRARAYVIQNTISRSILEQIVFNVNFGGSPFDIFGNKVGFNAGYEHRQEKGIFTADDFQTQGLGRNSPVVPVSGIYNVDEVFGEVVVPLVTPENGLWFLNNLQLSARGRYVDNTVNGGFFSWAAGGLIAPIRDVQFRGNYTKSFRAPAITELFLPAADGFDFVPDLCSPVNINGGAAPATRARNCGAFLTAFPNATPLDAAQASVPSRTGGNPGLQNEVANSFTYGVVLQPRFIPGLSISVDYVNIKISAPIANLTVAQITSGCFDNEDFNLNDPANGNAFCSQIRRFARGAGGQAANGGDRGGQVNSFNNDIGVFSGFVNGQRVFYDGIQSSLNYRRPLSGLGIPGAIEFGGELLFVRTRINDITGIAPVRTDGVVGDPTWQGQLNIRYIGERFGLSTSLNYTGEQLTSRINRRLDIREIDKIDDFWTVNQGMYVDVDKKFRLSLTITNLFNRQFQRYFGGSIPASYNDNLGRRFAISVRAKY